ncbi:MAG: N-acetyltransferase [Candidatus Methanoperedens sp.]|nr:N-acetyltransferase [Candidatus Methanoperedens sp.]
MRKIARGRSLTPHIRQATKDDLSALLSLEKICFKEETFHIHQIQYLLLKAKSIVLLAETDGNIVGSMIILLRKHILNARIYSLNVHPEYRRKGVASSLMDFALDQLEKKGYGNISLETGINNNAARNLYFSKGFNIDRRLSNYYSNGDDAFHLIKKL